MGMRNETIDQPLRLKGGVYLTTPAVARVVGVASNTIRHWLVDARRQPDAPNALPAPDAIVGQTPIWRDERIYEWCERTGRACERVT